MRIMTLLAGLGGALLAAVPADAAVVAIRADIYATGFTITPPCNLYAGPGCGTTVAASQARTLEYKLDTDSLAVGGSFDFAVGDNSNAGTYSGKITRTGLETFAGSNYLFAEDRRITGLTGQTLTIITRLTAPSFAVVQVSPTPAPEPGTWAMMILGFGAIGGAVRYRKRRISTAFA